MFKGNTSIGQIASEDGMINAIVYTMPNLAQAQELAVVQKKEVNLLQGYTLCRAKL
jgi:hypothetical protein